MIEVSVADWFAWAPGVETQDDWKAWHEDETFQETRQRMEGLQEGPDELEWFEVVTEGRESART